MRDSLRPDGTTLRARTGHRSRSVLCGAVAALLGTLLVAPPPAAAAPKCGRPGGPGPTEAPWALRRLDPSSAWRITRGEGVTVAVVDSGVSPTHPLLKGRVLGGGDFNGLAQLRGQCDLAGHGTIVAGIIAGQEGTGAPYSGIAPEARILPVRVLASTERTTDEALPAEIAEAIRWSVDHGADVVNLSLVTLDRPELKDAIDYALRMRVVVVAAAGNRQENQQDQPAYPAAYPGVIAVAGVDAQGGHVGTSVAGDYVDIAAPGLDIVGPAPQGAGYLAEPQGGTSFAAAYVSGVAALVRAAHPELAPADVAFRLTRTADNPPDGHNAEIGYGVVNPYRAVTSLLGTRTDPPPGALAEPAPPADPLDWQRTVAVWVAAAGALLAGVLLAVRPVLARGRRRGWRPGRRSTPLDA
ncbi:type VII secretion-associated serine protease mycosin [Micromonospora kangleipakensis]|uniref:Type VII secretion-associated serine protease mycosin n=1 Tax=Micromonospora kangleipakensis TaxID=1077942 RepID=A0A4Q8B7E0_9ACTN|nr:type VII secretion-associated serine protease mycosin [Micromonospora kangleipakensis]RZU72985.1 type VII secretion-associated serine protease mycosin [Micromonospora kangleipakensis]